MTPARLAIELAFWLCAGASVYTYLIYPLVIYTLSRLFGRTPKPPTDAPLPSVALIIAAYNEAATLEARIQNALETDYPRGRFQIVIASDGSTDATPQVCEKFEGQTQSQTQGQTQIKFQPLLFPTRRGKATTLEDAIRRTDADVLILSDANTFMDKDAARLLTRWFQDPNVGAVCGRLVLTDPGSGRNADGLYWRYETFLKSCEARLGALLGANGAIYAIRRELATPIPPNTIVDDFVIPLAAKLRTNCRVVYEPLAIAREETAPNLHAEFGRRARIGAGGWQSLATLWPLLSPTRGWTALALWSHKVLRWTCPLTLIGALAASAALARSPIFGAITLLQLAFHAVCIFAAIGPTSRFRFLRLCGMFFAMNLALLVGLARWLRGGHTGIWRRTARTDEVRSTALGALRGLSCSPAESGS